MRAPARGAVAAVAAVAALAALAGCPAPGGTGAGTAGSAGSGSAGSAGSAGSGSAGSGAGAPAPSQEERLAAIQKAMNELDEGVQGCWAAAAVARFDIAGEITATIDIGPTVVLVAISRNTTQSPPLVACVSRLLTAYRWAPPLYGQAIQLPFRFRAPDGQSVIDRRLVPWKGQGAVSVAVLLDAANSGNGAASIFEVAIAAGGATGARIAERAELWYFLTPAAVEVTGSVTGAASRRAVAAGDMMYVPASGARNVIAAGEARAVIVAVPGGREGTARAGALPTPELSAIKSGVAGPAHLPASAAKRYPRPAGAVTIFAEPSTIQDRALAGSIIELPKGAAIPEHVHAGETELLYVLAGAGTMTVRGIQLPVGPTSVVQIPPNTPHSFAASDDFRGVQIYTPAGPEQRFKAPPPPAAPPAPRANP